ncbi:rhomboid family intramembrane serine protease [Dechloromonas sp. XY25]|uniref:Rhomboid family intramembrane serine protease n=1 Tax=Dechloromonas hankyongensis TaxID=2908002 RepID=A0ABS9JYT4_9RHOO|nr:rhomboid family intramembrane serine protease [Dechloromonas hankyongensis]MCG2576074.1 rhomboid family intramembrane serine protease [Dechloromonas hankyongensis]
MNETLPAQDFHASSTSYHAKSRRWLWWSAPLSIPYLAYTSKGSPASQLVTAAIVLGVFALIDFFLRRSLGNGKALVILDDQGIRSPLLPGREKQIAWPDIVGMSLTKDPSAKQIQFELAETPERKDRRKFWNGVNEARPALPLASFDAATQAALLQAIQRRLAERASPLAGQASEISRELSQENEFQETLKALAPTPWLTWLLVAGNVAIWLVTLGLGGGLAHSAPDKLLTWGGNAASAVQQGEWWRLLSATFLHSGLMHVAMNMIGLVAAGVSVERIYGQRLYAIIYLGAGLMGSALSLHFSAQKAVSVGASGAVFGVTGALLVAVLQHRDKLPKAFSKQTSSSLGIFIIYALLQGFSKPGIDNAAHIGGLLGGCLLAWVLPEKFDLAHFTLTYRRRAMLAIVLALGGTATVAAFAPHAPIDLKKAMASRENFAQAMDSFNRIVQTIQHEQKKFSEKELDERAKTIYVPAFRQTMVQFDQVVLFADDPRQPLLKDMRRTSELMLELLEMPEIAQPGSDKLQPADPARVAAIEAELQEISARVVKLTATLKKSAAPR